MTNTHKKVLGFVGLGLVAALTTFAAAVPAPNAAALDSVSDNLRVRVLAGEPEIAITSISGSVVTDPNYNITADYENLFSLKVVLVNRNADNEVIWEETLVDEATSTAPDELALVLNLDDYNGKGNYTVTFTGTGEGGVPVERIVNFTYTNTGPSVEPEDDKPSLDPQVPQSVTTELNVRIYSDLTGELLKDYTIQNPSESQAIDFSDLGDGLYRVDLVGKDKNGGTTVDESLLVLSGAELPVKMDAVSDFRRTVVTIKDADGNVVATEEFTPVSPGSIYTIDMSSLPAGDYTEIVDYYDENGDWIATTEKEFRKIDNSRIDVDVPPIDTVTTVEAYIYDADGNLVRVVRADRATGLVTVYDTDGNPLFTVENGYSDQGFIIPMEGLPYGEYTGVMMYRNYEGRLVGDTMPFQIIYNPETPVVPDTGNFFQGLNLTREDYLISGLAIFVAVSIVAFWLVKRNKSNRR